MTEIRELVLKDFQPVELPGGINYLTATVGQYEITLEPHQITGFCVGIYHPKEKLALEKRAIWLRNHPAKEVPPHIPGRVAERAIEYANQLLTKYL